MGNTSSRSSRLDRISKLPDSILCHILSFLPTKFAATTSILSKRWKFAWLSVLALNFDDQSFNDYESFRKFVHLTIFELRDEKTSIHSFTLKLGESSLFNRKEYNQILKFVMQRGIKYLDFNMSDKKRLIKSPPAILSFKTLEVLKLALVTMGNFDQVDFPRLKTLHLNRVYFKSPEYFVKLLFGCPILEDLHTKSFIYESGQSHVPMENLNALPNLVKMSISWKRLPIFHNLIHMELWVHDMSCDEKCTWLLGILSHFPKLQHFIIQNCGNAMNICYNCWKHPRTVPECISSQLKTCCIRVHSTRRKKDKDNAGKCCNQFLQNRVECLWKRLDCADNLAMPVHSTPAKPVKIYL
ncbi:hypothetical protein TSUD_408960 [Trifolium subterraneum]|uniref:F-box domain-containing protein n=1 Tax=Trifolium subterraneum TaxID=3900 RepID=A0A2Z6P6H2_TRISU|nr:hypothetical protein TSUD_408960 [Trifolium subterraneum]